MISPQVQMPHKALKGGLRQNGVVMAKTSFYCAKLGCSASFSFISSASVQAVMIFIGDLDTCISAADSDLMQPKVIDDMFIKAPRLICYLTLHSCDEYAMCFSHQERQRIFSGTTLCPEPQDCHHRKPGTLFNQAGDWQPPLTAPAALRLSTAVSLSGRTKINRPLLASKYGANATSPKLHELLGHTVTRLKPEVVMCEVEGI